MKRIAVFCVTFNSDWELERYRASIAGAADRAAGLVAVEVFVARNTKVDNPGYFGGIRRLMKEHDPAGYDYCIVSNVDITVDEDFFVRLVGLSGAEGRGWIAPQIWSEAEQRDRNPKIVERYSLRKLQVLRLLYRFPVLDWLYTRTVYRRKRYVRHEAGDVYAGHGSFIVLTRRYFERCGIIDYPVFLFCEEIYLAEECRRAGLRVCYEPSLRVCDAEHASTGRMGHGFYCRCNYEAMQYIISTYYTKH